MIRTRPKRLILLCVAVAAGVVAPLTIGTPASAVPGLVLVGASSAYDTSYFKGMSAQCPAGTHGLGGGADITGGTRAAILSMVPTPASAGLQDRYYAEAADDGWIYGVSWLLSVWAICGSVGTGWEIVQAQVTGAPGEQFVWARATCPGSKKVIGTGGISSGEQAVLDSIIPASDLRSVTVETFASELTSPSERVSARAYAVCIDPAPSQQRVGTASAYTSSNKFLSVVCPTGTKVHGVGGGLNLSSGQAHLDRLSSSSSLDAGAIDAREDATGTAVAWQAYVYAICAA